MNRIADARTTLTLDDAKALMGEIAAQECAIIAHTTRAQRRIDQIKSDLDCSINAHQAEALAARERLSEYILAHRELFQNPRKIKCAHGEFGLQTVTDLIIEDEPTLINALMEHGYDDCFISTAKPVKKAIRKRLEAGEGIPGAVIRTGDTAVAVVNRDLLDQALARAAGPVPVAPATSASE